MTLGFGTGEKVVLGGVGETGRVTGAGISGVLLYGHCRSRVLYCAMDKSQNLRGKEMVVGVYRKREREINKVSMNNHAWFPAPVFKNSP